MLVDAVCKWAEPNMAHEKMMPPDYSLSSQKANDTPHQAGELLMQKCHT